MSGIRWDAVIPSERLPPGFAEQIETEPLNPAVPRPAATAVLLRDSAAGMEVLLLKRHRSSGFVPGAYVFPGGRVDTADASAELRGLVREAPTEPSLEYWLATVREVFEETGVLLACTADGRNAAHGFRGGLLADLREGLMTDSIGLIDVLRSLDAVPDLTSLAYAAHWITPLVEPRRYDTRFFYAKLPEGAVATADAREMSDARWLRPVVALTEFAGGRLPMVFPTVRTLEGLKQYDTTDAALDAARKMTIRPILPSLVRVPGGVGLIIENEDGPSEG
ncbi:MAG TPA: NUDIX domain-containing protein [Longimicrobiales bacterium]